MSSPSMPPSTDRRPRGPRSATPVGTAAELSIGAVLLGLSALAGLAFVHRPWPNRLDVWGFRLLPLDSGSRWGHDAVALGSLTALLVGVFIVFFVGIWRDWVRAVACACAPVIAVLIVQDLAKPLVGRHLGLSGASSYPSGTVAAVAALATAATLVAPRIIRPLVALAAATATVGVCAAVVILRWHYPTDALGGIGVGVGSVLVLDALLHVPWAIAAAVRSTRSVPGVNRPRQPRLA
jgi:membrane-associated phospholipid phosphatase